MSAFWTAKFTGTFKRGYKRLSEKNKRRVETAIETLLTSDDPTKEVTCYTAHGKDATHMKWA